MSDALLPDGYLFLGHAETLRGLSHDFHLCQTHDTFYYRKRGASELQNTTPARAGRSDTWIGDVVRAVEPTASWVDAIQRASTRITELTDGRARRVTRRTIGSSPPRSWDLGLVLELLRKERFADALDVLDALPPDSHDDPDALLLRAVLLTNNGHLVASEELCTRLLGFDELNAGAHYLMALCREHAGDREGAVKRDEAAIHLDAGFAMPHLHLGLLARRSGNAAVARRELGQALILLAREDASRLLLFGGGFSREMLVSLCRTELSAIGGET
jgi:chemotaxis protein methyltransferase CheR